ncbi:MAG: hypothetical protein HQ494_15855 [Rhodospirillales bacterium]|nr:hypothetical protein [Rhodospirillales bacterium]
MSTLKAPTPHAWMINEFQARDEPLKAEIGFRNEEFLQLTVYDLDKDELFGDEFEAHLEGSREFEDEKFDSLRQELDFFRRENEFDSD